MFWEQCSQVPNILELFSVCMHGINVKEQPTNKIPCLGQDNTNAILAGLNSQENSCNEIETAEKALLKGIMHCSVQYCAVQYS